MSTYYTFSDVVIDPVYPSLEEYKKDYDYDLLGNRLKTIDRYLLDPTATIREVEEKHFFSILLYLIILTGVGFAFTPVIRMIKHIFGSLKVLLSCAIGMKKACSRRNKRLADGLPNDSDEFAMEVYRIITKWNNIADSPIPKDRKTFQAIRFVLESLWPTGYAFEELSKYMGEMSEDSSI
ncbi:unnamed protein product [Protopolystoma xenopodis]|uniref:Uncharacterized protein n=1 Tax=Protopolystoma xenopodis TaxID=117903 RepID=A0A448WF46_9PLAT|nr:unnamed protein product [Protopolystoma xenopodis]